MQQENQVNSVSGPNPSPASTGATGTATTTKTMVNGGRFDFDDGGTYCGGWEDGKAHGHGVCTGPKGQGAYSGSWHYGFEVSGVYTWPSGSAFEGQWQNGKRHGLGVEMRGRWLYRGEWTQGFKGRYGVRQSSTSNARYEGTWANGLQDGYGSETYADGGTYQGQWLRGMRHGYGVRASAPFGMASHYRPNKTVRASMTSLRSTEAGGGSTVGGAADPSAERDRRVDDSRGGFVLKARSDEPPARRRSLVEKGSNIKSIFSRMRKQRSTGDLDKRGGNSASIRSTSSNASWISTESSQSGMTNASVHTDSNASFVVEDEQMDESVTETYMGEWKNDKRSGFGISERSDGLRYEGEWFANKKYGYGVTTFRDGSKEEGKYKNNVLITSQKKKHLFLIRSAKFRERIDAAVNAAQRASKIALQKADIAISRTATARGKAELADMAADHAREDSDIARATAKQFAPDFQQPGLDKFRSREHIKHRPPPEDAIPAKSILQKSNDQSVVQQQTTQQPAQQPYQQNQQSYQHNQHSYQQKHQPYQQNQQPYQQSQQPYQQNQQPYQQNQQPNQHSQQGLQQNQQPYQPNQQPHYTASVKSVHMANMTTDSEAGKPYTNKQDQVPNRVPNAIPAANPKLPQLPSQNEGGPTPVASVNNPNVTSVGSPAATTGGSNISLRRNSRVKPAAVPEEMPAFGYQQSMNDRFDHYKRPPSRDSSVDRYQRAASRLGGLGSRQSSVDKAAPPTAPGGREVSVDRTLRGPSATRGNTPSAGNGAVVGAPLYSIPNSLGPQQGPFEEVVLRNRTLGQDIIPSPGQPKRTESLFINSGGGGGGGSGGGGGGGGGSKAMKSVPAPTPLQRKKSLPDFQGLPKATDPMSREEVSVLSSARREEVRRQAEEAERLRANPLLYLVSPHVKDWFSRQQLVMLVLFINISLAIMFFKLLT